ncbi:hypothetical protein TIFTF001_027014 [Ficus carica]|uniref:Uncharacterized protein n=1 Tax=Ficus carica TaxID=3494 RepID=A0AA88DME3_FICCA|nr:hypothetical protein TIFTF001_027014 [Ficus carica]
MKQPSSSSYAEQVLAVKSDSSMVKECNKVKVITEDKAWRKKKSVSRVKGIFPNTYPSHRTLPSPRQAVSVLISSSRLHLEPCRAASASSSRIYFNLVEPILRHQTFLPSSSLILLDEPFLPLVVTWYLTSLKEPASMQVTELPS